MPEILGTSKNTWNFDPRSIPACALWLDAADQSTITLSGTSVTQMKDKSSNSYTLTGSSGTYPTQTNTLNSLPVISTAVGKYLSISSFNQNFTTGTCFMVMRPTEDITPLNKLASGYPGYLVVNGIGTGAIGFGVNYANQAQTGDTTKFTVYFNKAGTGLVYGQLGGSSASTYNPVNTTLLMCCVMSGTTTTNASYVNGSSVTLAYNASGTFPSQTPSVQIFGHPTVSFGYDFAECILYGSTLGISQIQQIEGYLAWKWGLESIPQAPSVPSVIPTSISGCVLWLDAADTSTITGTTTMTAWRDKSSNAYTANSFSNSVAAPSWVSSAPRVGSAVQYSAGNGSSIANFVLKQTMSIFEVYYAINQSTSGPFIEHGPDENANSGFYLYSAGGENFGINSGSGQIAVNIGNVTLSNTWQLIEGINPDPASSSTMAFYVNGQVKASGATQSGTTTVTRTLFINGRNGTSTLSYNTYLAELIIFSNALNTTDRQYIERYLSLKWGLSNILPATHPFTTIQPSLRTFNPVDVGVDLALWLDAADASTIQLSGASNVVSWKDKSPNAYLLSNTTTASQPTYVTSGLNKSYPCVRVNGSVTGGNQFLSTPLFTGFTGTTWDVYMVVKTTGTQNSLLRFDESDRILILASGSGGNGAAYSIHWGSGGSGSWRLGPNIGAATTKNTYLYQLYSTGSLLGRRINGVVPGDTRTQTASQSYGVVSSAKPLFLCNPGGAWSTGDSFIGETLIFSNVLTDNQRQRVEGYLSDKWGLLTSHIPTGFSPTSIGGCQLWFDASDTSSITPSSITTGTKVSQWNDKSGNARHMSNATSASQPTYSTSNVAGSLPSVYFTGSSDASTNANILSNSASTVFNSTTWDVYAVFKPTSQSNETAIFWNDPTAAVVLICGSTTVYPVNSVHYGGWRLTPTDGPCRANEVQVYQVYSTGTTLGRRINGLADGTVAQTVSYSWPSRSSNSELAFTRPSTTTWTNGNTSLCEIIVYNTVLSDANRSNVESYLINKWYVGTGVQLGNPFYTFPPSTAVPWLPTNITGCFLWLDGADTSTLVLNGSNVTNWFDKSGNGFAAASQMTHATLVSSSFGGNTNLLFNGDSRYFCPTTAISNASYTIFTVQNTTSVSGGGSASGYQRVINANNYAFVGVLNGYVATFTGSGSGWNDTASNSPAFYSVNTNVLVSMSVSNAVLTPYFNGIAGTTKTGTTGVFSNFYIGNDSGGTQPWYGNISEIIVYNGILTTSQRQQVEGYLSWKWGLISSAAPSDSMKLLFWADQCRSATCNALSTIDTYASLFINKLALPVGLGDYSGTTLTIPYTGAYLIEISGWRCGAGSGQSKVIATRSGSTIYQRVRGTTQNDCGIWTGQYYWNLFQAGDVLTLYKSDNNAGTGPIGTTTSQNSTSDDARGPVKIWFIQ